MIRAKSSRHQKLNCYDIFKKTTRSLQIHHNILNSFLQDLYKTVSRSSQDIQEIVLKTTKRYRTVLRSLKDIKDVKLSRDLRKTITKFSLSLHQNLSRSLPNRHKILLDFCRTFTRTLQDFQEISTRCDKMI